MNSLTSILQHLFPWDKEPTSLEAFSFFHSERCSPNVSPIHPSQWSCDDWTTSIRIPIHIPPSMTISQIICYSFVSFCRNIHYHWKSFQNPKHTHWMTILKNPHQNPFLVASKHPLVYLIPSWFNISRSYTSSGANYSSMCITCAKVTLSKSCCGII